MRTVTQPGPGRIPTTPLLRYFRSSLCKKPRGNDWGTYRLAEARKWIDKPSRLAEMFEKSVKQVEREYRNYQPFYPVKHTFGTKGKTTTPHGAELRATVDVAARLASREIWQVHNNPQLNFRYLDREIPIARAKPTPQQDPGALLEVDLFLANAYDRTPILGEIKIRKDECPLFALIQLLTQATYAVTPTQRDRMVLFGSRPDFVLREAVPEEAVSIDLYVMLIEPPSEPLYNELRTAAIELSDRLIADERVASRIGRIAWISGTDTPEGSLALEEIAVAASRMRIPRRTRPPSADL